MDKLFACDEGVYTVKSTNKIFIQKGRISLYSWIVTTRQGSTFTILLITTCHLGYPHPAPPKQLAPRWWITLQSCRRQTLGRTSWLEGFLETQSLPIQHAGRGNALSNLGIIKSALQRYFMRRLWRDRDAGTGLKINSLA